MGVDGDKSKAANEIYKTTATAEEESEQGESAREADAPLAPQAAATPLQPPSPNPVVQKVEEKREEVQVKEETKEEKERREFEERAAVERALKIMEVLSDAKIFMMDMTLSDLVKKPKKRYKELFDMGYFSFLSAGVLGKDGEHIQQFFKPKAIVAVEGVKHIIGLKKEQRDAYKINIDAAAKEKAKLVERDDIAPKFWWRDMPEKFPDENAKMSDEKKKRLEEEREKNKKRTKWDNGVAFYQFS